MTPNLLCEMSKINMLHSIPICNTVNIYIFQKVSSFMPTSCNHIFRWGSTSMVKTVLSYYLWYFHKLWLVQKQLQTKVKQAIHTLMYPSQISQMTKDGLPPESPPRNTEELPFPPPPWLVCWPLRGRGVMEMLGCCGDLVLPALLCTLCDGDQERVVGGC